MAELSVGMRAPDFSAVDQNSTRHTLASLLEKGQLVLYFYPKDFTPVCTAQACTFRDAATDLAERGVHVVGVSTDSEESHRRFAAEHRVTFPLLADTDGAICDAYGGRYPLIRRTRRVTYVIGQDQKILGIFSHELSARKHLEDVLGVLGTKG